MTVRGFQALIFRPVESFFRSKNLTEMYVPQVGMISAIRFQYCGSMSVPSEIIIHGKNISKSFSEVQNMVTTVPSSGLGERSAHRHGELAVQSSVQWKATECASRYVAM